MNGSWRGSKLVVFITFEVLLTLGEYRAQVNVLWIAWRLHTNVKPGKDSTSGRGSERGQAALREGGAGASVGALPAQPGARDPWKVPSPTAGLQVSSDWSTPGCALRAAQEPSREPWKRLPTVLVCKSWFRSKLTTRWSAWRRTAPRRTSRRRPSRQCCPPRSRS